MEHFIITFRDIKMKIWSANKVEPGQTTWISRLAWLYTGGKDWLLLLLAGQGLNVKSINDSNLPSSRSLAPTGSREAAKFTYIWFRHLFFTWEIVSQSRTLHLKISSPLSTTTFNVWKIKTLYCKLLKIREIFISQKPFPWYIARFYEFVTKGFFAYVCTLQMKPFADL